MYTFILILSIKSNY